MVSVETLYIGLKILGPCLIVVTFLSFIFVCWMWLARVPSDNTEVIDPTKITEINMVVVILINLLPIIFCCGIYAEYNYMKQIEPEYDAYSNKYLDVSEKIIGVDVHSSPSIIVMDKADRIHKVTIEGNEVRMDVMFNQLDELKGMFLYSSSEKHFVKPVIRRE